MSAPELGRAAFAAAAHHIATNGDSLRVRLKQAVVKNLIELNPENLPDGMWGEFSGILTRLSRYAPKDGDGSIETTLRHMSDHEVEQIAGEISKMSERVSAAPV